MRIMHVAGQFLLKGRSLYQRMRSSEGTTLSMGDLRVLREQLQLLDAEAANLLKKKGKGTTTDLKLMVLQFQTGWAITTTGLQQDDGRVSLRPSPGQ
jgi:hypothetical protein